MMDSRVINSRILAAQALVMNNLNEAQAMTTLLGAICFIAFIIDPTEEKKLEFAEIIKQQIIAYPTSNEAVM